MVLSNDSHGDLSRRRINEGLTRGALVHCGFDNDAGGAKLWQQVKEAYPRAEAIVREQLPSGAKDWNDMLRAALGSEQSRSQGQREEREQTHDHGHGGHGAGGRERDDTPGHRR